MKNVLITKTETYANPVVSLPHTYVVKDKVFELDDAVADRIVELGGGEIVDSAEDVVAHESRDEIDTTGGWSGDLAAKLVENHKSKELKAACEQKGLDTDGNKTDLAKRLISAGITEI